MDLFTGAPKNAIAVITQIEAKKFEVAYNKTIREDVPSIFIYLTSECNMCCPHCYMYAGKKKDDELSLLEVKTILTEYRKYGGKKVCFSGGEICMRDDLVQILEHASELGYKIKLMTNGTLWTKELIDSVAPLIHSIQISIDGYNEEENAKIRGKGNFQKALDTVDAFYSKGKKVAIAITPFYDEHLEQKAHKFGNFGRYLLSKYGKEKLTLLFSTNLLDGRNINLSNIDNEKYKKIVTKIIYPLCYGEQVEAQNFISFTKEQNLMNLCAYGNPYISSTGDIAFCAELIYSHPVANIRTESFSKILHLREKVRKIADVNNLVSCKGCELKYICGGGCRVAFFKELVNYNIDNSKDNKIFSRSCNPKEKEYFYDLMIRTNQEIFMR